ncbi:MAG: hypothetical protein JKY94_06140 [Rhodobacteraceae bacterium]|nr:hypothetical protein [Paracoccaceae bacterium]
MAETMRADLGIQPGLSEKKMFGGLCALMSVVPIDHMMLQSALAFRHQMPAGFRVQRSVMAQKLALTPPLNQRNTDAYNQQSAKKIIQYIHTLNVVFAHLSSQGSTPNALH